MFDNLFEDFFNDDFFAPRKALPGPEPGPRQKELMRTDVKELKNFYKLKIDLPGYAKEDIKIKLDNGFLTISAEKKTEDTTEEDGRVIRRERYMGSASRSWYVGDKVKQEDIKAKYNNGVLSLTVPKEKQEPEPPEDKKYIAID